MLTAESIYKKYKRPVLNGISLAAAPGEIIGIAGENGSGKSTLLSILTSVIRPDSGHVTVEGERLSPRALREWVGYVPQENALFDELSARDNLKLWASAYRADWKNALDFLFAEETPERERREFLSKRVGKMSGGMKKRLSIALALTHKPRYILMDEPSAGLDISFKWTLSETIRDMKAKNRCVILTSHSADELLLCDRVCVLRGGAFIYDGPPEALNGDGGFGEGLRRLITGGGLPAVSGARDGSLV